jgi:type IV secretory pathway VirJ component
MAAQETLNRQSSPFQQQQNPKPKAQSRRNTWSQDIAQNHNERNVSWKQTCRPAEQTRDPRNKPTQSTDSQQGFQKSHTGERTTSSTNSTEKTERPLKKVTFDSSLILYKDELKKNGRLKCKAWN